MPAKKKNDFKNRSVTKDLRHNFSLADVIDEDNINMLREEVQSRAAEIRRHREENNINASKAIYEISLELLDVTRAMIPTLASPKDVSGVANAFKETAKIAKEFEPKEDKTSVKDILTNDRIKQIVDHANKSIKEGFFD